MINENDIYTRQMQMPTTIKSFVIAAPDGTFCVVLNSVMDADTQFRAYAHELRHIMNGDYEKKCSIDIIEINAHELDNQP